MTVAGECWPGLGDQGRGMERAKSNRHTGSRGCQGR